MRLLINAFPALALGVLCVGVVAATDPPATAPSTRPSIIPWNQARDHVGEEAIVVGPVVGTHDFRGAAVMNVGKDYPSPDRFTVYIPADKRKGMPDDLDIGKTITVSGKVKLFHNVPEIEGDSDHITIVDRSTTTPATQP